MPRSNGTARLNERLGYAYDGLLILQERDGNNTPTITYTRGVDLSGSLQGAGGIGGLLALSDQRASASNPTNYFYHADGNGNIVALINQRNEVVARYLHDPFGNLLAKSGPMADFNRQQFSSKERHHSGIILYEFRAYDPNLQRWLSQDPIGERGGINLYQFAYNDSVNWVDALGLQGVMGNLPAPKYDPGPIFPLPPPPEIPPMAPPIYPIPYDPNSTAYPLSEPSSLELMMTAGGPEGQLAKGAGKLLGAAFVKCKPIITRLKAAKSGETAATKAGRQAHKEWKAGEGFEKEVKLPSGKRADAVNFEQQHVKELKPDNSRAVKRGEKQVEEYRQELQKEQGGDWKGSVETYKR